MGCVSSQPLESVDGPPSSAASKPKAPERVAEGKVASPAVAAGIVPKAAAAPPGAAAETLAELPKPAGALGDGEGGKQEAGMGGKAAPSPTSSAPAALPIAMGWPPFKGGLSPQYEHITPEPEPGAALPTGQPKPGPSGMAHVAAGKSGVGLHYAYLTQRGFYPEAPSKANQDSFCACPRFAGEPDDHLFGVFDGHGEFGTPCSQFACDRLCENLAKHRLFRDDPPQALHAAFVSTNVQLHRYPGIDDSMSGTTGISVLLRGRTLYAANVGDSRAVLAERRGDALVAVDLSNDQTPFRADEAARVKACGARVLTLDQLEGIKNPNVQCWGGEDDDDGDPPRLWVQNGMYPGTAFTRSLGDTVAERIGVTAVPEVLVLELTANHPFFFVASDGVFEFLSSQAVVDMVVKYPDPHEAARAIVEESYRLWLQYETRTDDITIIIVHLSGLAPTKPARASSVRGLPGPPPRDPLSMTRVKAVEPPPQEEAWAARPDVPQKTALEVARIDRAVQGTFLAQNTSEPQRQLVYRSMERMTFQAGDIIVRQGELGDKFFVVEEGELDVFVAPETPTWGPSMDSRDLGKVVHRYSASASPCFGELALLYATRREATVQASTAGSAWVLTRVAYRSALLPKAARRSAVVSLLRGVPLLAPLTLLQLQRVAEHTRDVTFGDGDVLAKMDEDLDTLYVVEEGEVEYSLRSAAHQNGETLDPAASGSRVARPGQAIGEWVLLNQRGPRVAAAASGGPVRVLAVTRREFDFAVGSFTTISNEDQRLRRMQAQLLTDRQLDPAARMLAATQLAELEWVDCIYSTDCSEVGSVQLLSEEKFYSMKRFSKERVWKRGRTAAVLRERALLQALSPSPFVPALLCACADAAYVGLLLQARLACPLSLLLEEAPLPEDCCKYIAASVLLALHVLHKDGVVCRGIAPEMLLLDESCRLQLVDLRLAKKMTGDRTFTMCGVPEYLAPEIIAGQGHNQAADWWSFGVLIYVLLQGSAPFGSPKDSEMQLYSAILQRRLTFPSHFSSDVVDLIEKLLTVQPEERLGSGQGGVDAIRRHPWFVGTPWDDILSMKATVPMEVSERLASTLKERANHDRSPQPEEEGDPELEPGGTQWFEGW